jgi:arylsulfatase A-like enzyme
MNILTNAAFLIALSASAFAAPSRPNIVVILSDDMGFSDLGCYGGEIETPVLDTLAKGGVRFTQFYNTARCCPTRASLLTGLYPHQAGIGHMTDDRGFEGYRGELNRNCVTIAEALKPAGYGTYAVGKWHVTKSLQAKTDADKHNWPLQRGFDRFYGTIIGGGSFWDPSFLTRDNRQVSAFADPDYQPANGYYYTDAISDHAVRFVREHDKDKPFFLYVAYTAAHWPMHAREADIAKYKGRYEPGYQAIREARYRRMAQLGAIDAASTTLTTVPVGLKETEFWEWDQRNMEVYAAMVTSMDRGIGALVETLKNTGQYDNTLIFFMQDNGGCAEGVGRAGVGAQRAPGPTLPPLPNEYLSNTLTPKQTRDGFPVRQGKGVMAGPPDTYAGYGEAWAMVSNTPFREFKHWTHEGGISTPLIAHWPAAISGVGRWFREPAHLIDIMATCVDVAGAKYPEAKDGSAIKPMEGVSLRPSFAQQSLTPAPRYLFWEHEGNRAVRFGKWKLVAKERKPWELYDIDLDRSEQRDLAAMEPEQVRELAAKWDEYAARANVLPLGAWAGKRGKAEVVNSKKRFELKDGDRLERDDSPAIVGRAFSITANFTADAKTSGVIVAQGGSTHGYCIFVADQKLHVVFRRDGRIGARFSGSLRTGAQSVTVKLSADGQMRVSFWSMGGGGRFGLFSTQPADGLSVGRDEGGLVGDYSNSSPFTGKIESVVVQLD